MYNKSYAKRFCIIVVFPTIILGMLSGGPLSREGRAFDWQVLKKAFDVFVAQPSLENSRHFLEAVPEKESESFLKCREEVFQYICEGKFFIENGIEGWERYLIFEHEMWAGNPYILQAALRLYALAEDRYSWILCASISALVRVNPGLLLNALYERKQCADLTKMSDLLICLSEGYFFTTQAQLYELDMRIKALEGVKDERLAPLKDEYMELLRKQVEEIELAPILVWPFAEHYEEEPPETVKRAFEEFVRCPSTEKAKAFCDSVPLEEKKGFTDRIQHLIFQKGHRAERSQGYMVLEREAIAGSQYAAEALFRMYHLSPGGIDTLELRVSLSKLIRINPRLFLVTLSVYQGVLDPEWIEGLVRFLPIHYYENSQAIHEFEMRRKALEGVVDPSLRELRDYCIGVLSKIIEIRRRGL